MSHTTRPKPDTQLKRLDELAPVPRNEPADISRYFTPDAKQHPGRMKSTILRDLFERYVPRDRLEFVVADPLSGTGMTGLIAALMGVGRYIGCEVDPRWHAAAQGALTRVADQIGKSFRYILRRGDAGSIALPDSRGISMISTSPMFPNAHAQGKSPMQNALKASKKTFAGNDFLVGRRWGCGTTPNRQRWIDELARTMGPWIERCIPGAKICVHIKNYVHGGVEVRVDEWVAEALFEIGGVKVLGYHAAPLAFTSGFREWLRYPLRSIVHRRAVRGNDGGWRETLSCSHTKMRKPMDPAGLPVSARCVTCGVRDGHVEVTEERVVVARRR